MFSASIDADGLAKAVEKELAKAATAGIREATEATKQDVRAETRSALGGNRLPMAWRSRVFPTGRDSMDAAGWVEVRKSAAKLIDAFDKGVTIRASNGFWLAVPTPEAGRFGMKAGGGAFGATTNSRGARERITPAGFVRRTGLKLRFVYDSPQRSFLVVDAAQLTRGLASPYRSKGRGSRLYGPAGRTIVVFILVPQVRLKKRLDLDAVVQRAAARAPGMIVKGWRS